MSGLEFTSSLISSLVTAAWPTAVVVLGLALLTTQKLALARLIDRIKSVWGGPFRLETLPAEATPGAKEATSKVGEATGGTTWTGTAEGRAASESGEKGLPSAQPQVQMSREGLEWILTQYGQAGWDIAGMGTFKNRPRPVIEWDEEGVPQLLYWTTRPQRPDM
jgi:hypothetical protein